MDKTEKLIRKLVDKDSEKLMNLIKKFLAGEKGLDIKKIFGTGFYGLKQGRFRIIFHYNEGRKKIDSIKLRDERTYKNFK